MCLADIRGNSHFSLDKDVGRCIESRSLFSSPIVCFVQSLCVPGVCDVMSRTAHVINHSAALISMCTGAQHVLRSSRLKHGEVCGSVAYAEYRHSPYVLVPLRRELLQDREVLRWSGIAQPVSRLATDWTVRVSNPGVGEIFRTRPDRPQGPSSQGHRVFPGVKAAGAWR